MELYGGGMAGKSNNYQLGGRIAGARRRRGQQKEFRQAQRRAEADAARQQRASGLGSLLSTVGSVAGSFIPIPGVGTALGAAIGSGLGAGLGRLAGESTYKGSDFGGGKYFKETRKDLQRASDDFADSRGERALTQGLTSAVKSYAPSFTDAARDFGIGGKKFGEEVTKQGLADNPWLAQEESLMDFLPMEEAIRPDVPMDTGMAGDLFNYATDAPDMTELFSGNLDMSDLVAPEDAFSTFMPANDFTPSSYEDFINFGLKQGPIQRKGGLIDYMMPKYLHGGKVHTGTNQLVAGVNDNPLNKPNQYGVNLGALQGLTNSGWGIGDVTGSILGSGQGLAGNKAYQDFISKPPTAGTPGGMPGGMSGGGSGPGSYGTATGVMSALQQMGMGDVANDPRLQEYLEDLPQFGMGYSQQIGDIFTSAGQQAGGVRSGARQAAGATGFAGSGATQAQSEKSLKELGTETARQRRGVVEGYQADLLSAIGDIEAKGEFEFGEEGLQDRQKTIDFLKKRFPNLSDDKISAMADAAG